MEKVDGGNWIVYAERESRANEMLGLAFQWGVLVPGVLAIVAVLGWWVYRGFKPKA